MIPSTLRVGLPVLSEGKKWYPVIGNLNAFQVNREIEYFKTVKEAEKWIKKQQS